MRRNGFLVEIDAKARAGRQGKVAAPLAWELSLSYLFVPRRVAALLYKEVGAGCIQMEYRHRVHGPVRIMRAEAQLVRLGHCGDLF